jgi:hypothetical protein
MYAIFEAKDLQREYSGTKYSKNDNGPSMKSTKQPAANSAAKMDRSSREQVNRDQISSKKKSKR